MVRANMLAVVDWRVELGLRVGCEMYNVESVDSGVWLTVVCCSLMDTINVLDGSNSSDQL